PDRRERTRRQRRAGVTAPDQLRSDALAIWSAAVDAVRPEPLVENAVRDFPRDWQDAIRAAPRIVGVGAGKACAAMAAGLEMGLRDHLDKLSGFVNVPEGSERRLRNIYVHAARPAGSNHPTGAGVAGVEEMLGMVGSAGPDDVVVCLLSGG